MGVPGGFRSQELYWSNPWTVIWNIHHYNRHTSFIGLFCFLPLFRGRLVDRFFFCWWMNGQPYPISHCGRCQWSQSRSWLVVETRRTIFFSRWTLPCLSCILSFCRIGSFNRASWSCPLPFPFFAGWCSKEHVSPFWTRAFWRPRATIFAKLSSYEVISSYQVVKSSSSYVNKLLR